MSTSFAVDMADAPLGSNGSGPHGHPVPARWDGIVRPYSTADVERIFPEGSRKRAAFAEKGSVLVGDVHPDVEAVAGAITPVPGGVGPLTVAMVLRNTVTAAELRAKGKAGM